MKVLIAPSAYKGTFTPVQLTAAIRDGVEKAAGNLPISNLDIVECPIADGGDGTLECLHHSAGGEFHEALVRGPLQERISAKWLQLGHTAVVELAQICGLALLKEQKLQPLDAHTTGLGEMVVAAFDGGMRDIIIAVGGSASTDGGAGMLTACGAHLVDGAGETLRAGGGALRNLERCEVAALSRLSNVSRFRVAADVTNPLLGCHGAASVYGPQKGASAEQVMMLDEALGHYADLLEKATGRICRNVPGAGAAGGTAFGAMCGLGAQLVSGFRLLAELTLLEEKVASCDLVITGEGALDNQSLMGKGTGGLIAMCRRQGKPLLAVPAVCEKIDWQSLGIALVISSSQKGRGATLSDVSLAAEQVLRQFVESKG